MTGPSSRAARPAVLWAPVAIMLCATALACGSHPATVSGPEAASHVCAAGQRAAARAIGAQVQVSVSDADPVNIACTLRGGGLALQVVDQVSATAWAEYGTMQVHQVQAYGSGSVYEPLQLPQAVPGMSGNAGWIPAQSELFATNGTPSAGGSYVTVRVTGRGMRGASGESAARAVAQATLAAAPRAPNPPTPSS